MDPLFKTEFQIYNKSIVDNGGIDYTEKKLEKLISMAKIRKEKIKFTKFLIDYKNNHIAISWQGNSFIYKLIKK